MTPATPKTRSTPPRHALGGFTLVEMMIAVVVLGVLASVALPAYKNYVTKSRAQSAGADLVALALNMENSFQLSLSYPVNAAGTAATSTKFPAWAPSQSANFNYTVQSDASSYTLTATGKSAMSSCVMTLNQANTRTATSACVITSW